MPSSRSLGPPTRACVLILAAAAIAGCGTSKADLAKAEKAINAEFKTQGLPVRVNCPADAGSGEFNCDVKSTVTGKVTPVKFTMTGKDDDVLDVADQQTFQKTLLAAGG